MNFNIITIFPKIFDSYFNESILARAQKENLIKINVYNLRDFTTDKHLTVDDTPYGGGAGMVMKVEPIFNCVQNVLNVQNVENVQGVENVEDVLVVEGVENVEEVGSENSMQQAKRLNKRSDTALTTLRTSSKSRTILFSAKGKKYTQRDAERLKKYDNLIMICGRYEGVDERVAEHIADEEFSIGEYVLTGGEIPAMLVVDSVSRLLPGVLGNKESLSEESFGNVEDVQDVEIVENVQGDKLVQQAKQYNKTLVDTTRRQSIQQLEYPHYTKPEEFNGWKVPEILLGGNHAEIEKWREKHRT